MEHAGIAEALSKLEALRDVLTVNACSERHMKRTE